MEVTLKSNWHAQQQQPVLNNDVTRSQEIGATWESKARLRDKPKTTTGVEIASRKLVRPIPKVDDSTHLSQQEFITDAFSDNEANTQEIENWFEQKFFREDFAKEKVVLELIQLIKSSIQCPSCLHDVFVDTILCRCGKMMQPDEDVMNRIREVIAIL